MATLQGNAAVNGAILSSSQLIIIDSPDILVRCYTDYPSRMPVYINQIGLNIGSSMPNWATHPGVLQDLDYILDVSVPTVPVGTAITITSSLASGNIPSPIITPLDGGVLQANGISRFKVKFPAVDLSVVPEGEIDYSVLMKFTTSFGAKDHFFRVWYNSTARPAIGSIAPLIYNSTLPLFLPINSFIDIGITAGGAGGSGNNNGTPNIATVGGDGGYAVIITNNFGQFMSSLAADSFGRVTVAAAYEGKGGRLNSTGKSTSHGGYGGDAVVTPYSPVGQGISGGNSIVSSIRLERETIFKENGKPGSASVSAPVGGLGMYSPIPIMQNTIFQPGHGGFGGTDESPTGYGAGGGSGGSIILRLIYSNIPFSGASADLKARSKYVPPLRLFVTRSDDTRGGSGGIGNSRNGSGGTNGRVAVIDYGTF